MVCFAPRGPTERDGPGFAEIQSQPWNNVNSSKNLKLIRPRPLQVPALSRLHRMQRHCQHSILFVDCTGLAHVSTLTYKSKGGAGPTRHPQKAREVKHMRRLATVAKIIAALTLAAALHYALPQVDVVRIVGTDVKRVDSTQQTREETADTDLRTVDVYFILAETSDGDVRNYRNEDALIYGKFDSSDLHTRARSISQNQANIVAIRHYGWRISFLSMFPNAVAVWEVESDYRHLPIFNIIVLGLLVSGVGYVIFRLRKIRARLAKQRAEREAERAAEEFRRAQERVAVSDATADRNKARDDFLSEGSTVSEAPRHNSKQDRKGE